MIQLRLGVSLIKSLCLLGVQLIPIERVCVCGECFQTLLNWCEKFLLRNWSVTSKLIDSLTLDIVKVPHQLLLHIHRWSSSGWRSWRAPSSGGWDTFPVIIIGTEDAFEPPPPSLRVDEDEGVKVLLKLESSLIIFSKPRINPLIISHYLTISYSYMILLLHLLSPSSSHVVTSPKI